jgi:hypothetical protein
MNDTAWEELAAALTLHGYMYDRVKQPPSLLLRGVNGLIILQREHDGHGVHIHQLGDTDLVVHPTLEGLLNEVGRRCGAPRMSQDDLTADIGVAVAAANGSAAWITHNPRREWR